MDNITRMAYYERQNDLQGTKRKNRTKREFYPIFLTHRQTRRLIHKRNRTLPRSR